MGVDLAGGGPAARVSLYLEQRIKEQEIINNKEALWKSHFVLVSPSAAVI
jgi:hypothetical protein